MAEHHRLREPASTASLSWHLLDAAATQRCKEGPMAKMPSLDHLTREDYDVVYEPSDDTFLLLDGIALALNQHDNNKSEINADTDACQYTTCTTLEIGCGTGVPTIYLANELKRRYATTREQKRQQNRNEQHNEQQQDTHDHDHHHHVTDINPDALRIAESTARANHVGPLHLHQCDLATPLLGVLENQVDILVFNPPYVPTAEDEVGSSTGIEASWAGGLHGRHVIDRAIPQMPILLKRPHGVAFIITVDDNKPMEMQAMFAALGLDMKPWVRRRARNEYLTVQRVQWRQDL